MLAEPCSLQAGAALPSEAGVVRHLRELPVCSPEFGVSREFGAALASHLQISECEVGWGRLSEWPLVARQERGTGFLPHPNFLEAWEEPHRHLSRLPSSCKRP